MAIISNRVTEDGDVLIIQTSVPVLGLISLTQFVDTTVNESETDYFEKEFRYSENGGLTFSDWTVLNLLNIEAIEITKYDSFVIEYRYTRVGNTPALDLEFNDILVSGEVEDLTYPLFDKVVFKKFFNVNDINVFGWALNVLEKIYEKGNILPSFYERALNRTTTEDEDFIVYWNSITHFFALLVYFARQFDNISNNSILLTEFLKSKDLILPIDKNIEDLTLIFNNYIEEFKKRGTSSIVDRTGNVDGELIRLLDSKVYNELNFCLFQNFNSGWCIGKSSPLWIGTENILNIIKGYEKSNEVLFKTNYPLVGDQYITVTSGKLILTNSSGITGIKYSNDDSFKIVVDDEVDYEISFKMKQSVKVSNISFGVQCWDKNNNELIPTNIYTEGFTNYFFENQSLPIAGAEYWVRGVLFSSNKTSELSRPNIGYGYNLKLRINSSYIVPIIVVNGDGATDVEISDVVIRPRKLNFSQGQLGTRKILYIQARNNNMSFNSDQLDEIVRSKLIPYDCILKSNWLIEETQIGD